MDQETKQLLLKSIAIGEDNARMIRGIRRSMRIATLWRMVYILFFLGGAVWAYQYLEPYYIQARDAYTSVVETQVQVKEGIDKVQFWKN